MFELRKERMSLFVINARKEIEGLWDDLLFSEDERAEFNPYQDGKPSGTPLKDISRDRR